jgi:hypothetical protein
MLPLTRLRNVTSSFRVRLLVVSSFLAHYIMLRAAAVRSRSFFQRRPQSAYYLDETDTNPVRDTNPPVIYLNY